VPVAVRKREVGSLPADTRRSGGWRQVTRMEKPNCGSTRQNKANNREHRPQNFPAVRLRVRVCPPKSKNDNRETRNRHQQVDLGQRCLNRRIQKVEDITERADKADQKSEPEGAAADVHARINHESKTVSYRMAQPSLPPIYSRNANLPSPYSPQSASLVLGSSGRLR